MNIATRFFPIFLLCRCLAAVTLDTSAVRPGPITVTSTATSATVRWTDEANRPWTAEFSLDPKAPLITAISVNGAAVIERARPFYQLTTGKRRGGWDAFFDFPPSHPDGTRTFQGAFTLTSAKATTIGNRVELSFGGLRAGIFEGTIRYVIYPGSRLVEQIAVMSTSEPDTAYFYDTGLRMSVEADRRPGGNMESRIAYYDTSGEFKTILSEGSERHSLSVRYRTVAARTGAGSVAIFPSPHQYFMPRDYTTNMGYVWHTAWRGLVSLGIRQYADDASPYYPWANAPPGTAQRMNMFLLLHPGEPRAALEEVLKFTHYDRFPAIDGYTTFAPHWHVAYTVQAMEKGFDWIPPFKPVLQAMGVNSAMIMDFHGDGHPRDPGETRLRELKAFYDACRKQSGPDFLLIPGEEANVHFGGHWSLSFPKPVLWHMDRKREQAFKEKDAKYGTVYNVADAKELLDLVRAEDAWVYQTHPRTKGSTGFPDQIRDSAHFMDPHYFGAGFKAMPADLSSPRLSERAFKLVDDMSNWGLKKQLVGEVDVFQIDSTHELYTHMNVNYVKLPALPAYDNYGKLLDALRRSDFFTTTGEVLLPEVSIKEGAGGRIAVRAHIQHTFPLAMAEVVWGDGSQTQRKIFPLTETRPFGDFEFKAEVDAGAWKWARIAVWDVAADGAFVNPVWRGTSLAGVVAVDAYHNNETKDAEHYRWEGTRNGGYSQLGAVIQGVGGELRTVREPMTAKTLKGVDVLMIADPDTPAEASDPKYISAAEIDALAKWVSAGGRLVLFGNDKGNAEFEHFNKLAARFGIEFVETIYRDAAGKSKLNLQSQSAVLGAGLTAYLVDVAPLKITSPNFETLLADGGTPIMALVRHGKGLVVALGDPWIYNEYINSKDNHRMAENLFRRLLQRSGP